MPTLGTRSWIALGAGAYLAFVLATFPASVAYRWLAPPSLSLIGVDGTVWSGRAAFGSVSGLALRDVAWRLTPWRLLLGTAGGRAEARLADGFAATEFSAGLRRVALRGLQASTSLPVLQPLLPVDGMFGLASLSFERLELERGWPVRADGQIRLQQLEVTPLMPTAGGELIELGDYEIVFVDGGGDAIEAEIRDAGGPLEVAATLMVDRARAYVLEGTVRPRPSASALLVQGLDLMTGEPDAAGRRALGLTGSL